MQRINQYLSSAGVCSRRAADALIADGRVRINGRLAQLGDLLSQDDVVTVDGNSIEPTRRRVYIAYHKPLGVESTTNRSVHRNLLDELGVESHLFPIGRLDKDSTGLLLLTNDGDIVNRILRSQFAHEKEYLVHIDRPVTTTFLKAMREGVAIGRRKTLPAVVARQNPRAFRIVLVEGRNRQIRRMCEKLGAQVTSLKRVRIMNVLLGHLKPGAWRNLYPKEQRELLRAIGSPTSPR